MALQALQQDNRPVKSTVALVNQDIDDVTKEIEAIKASGVRLELSRHREPGSGRCRPQIVAHRRMLPRPRENGEQLLRSVLPTARQGTVCG